MWSIFNSDFWNGNIPLITGASISGADQLVDAVEYYLQIKATNPNIRLTGHSLGGALASLVGVFFGETAFTFDQVPAAATAAAGPANLLYNALLDRGYTAAELTGLNNYIQQQQISGGIPNAGLVTNYNVQGEIAGNVPGASRIGNDATIECEQAGISASDLHAQALLTVFLQSNLTAEPDRNLSDATFKLPDLLKMIFDKVLFARSTATSNATEENFLERLVKHEAGVKDSISADAMVTRFTSDLWKLAQDGGLTMSDQNPTNAELHELSNALIAFAMQYYYEDTANAVDAQKELFATDGIANGLRFDLGDVSEKIRTALEAGKEADLAAAKGYQYFANYLKQDALFSAEELTQIKAWLPWMRDWTVQAGEGGMTATDSQNRSAFMLGGKEADTLTGGTADDLLAGNAGADTLDGNAGNDILLGGTGQDTLKGGEGVDLLIGGADNDSLDGGAGNDILMGGTGHDTYLFAAGRGTDIVIDADGLGILKDGATDRILVRDWQAGRLGIALPAAPAATLAGDFKKKIDGHDTPETDDDTHVMTDGNYTPIPGDAFEANALDLISGTGGADVIDAGGSTDKCRRWGDGIPVAWAGRNSKVGAGETACNGYWRVAA